MTSYDICHDVKYLTDEDLTTISAKGPTTKIIDECRTWLQKVAHQIWAGGY